MENWLSGGVSTTESPLPLKVAQILDQRCCHALFPDPSSVVRFSAQTIVSGQLSELSTLMVTAVLSLLLPLSSVITLRIE
jgi:hypothetical protein